VSYSHVLRLKELSLTVHRHPISERGEGCCWKKSEAESAIDFRPVGTASLDASGYCTMSVTVGLECAVAPDVPVTVKV
jgi:hypothetical protein